jgi:peptidoglycan/xylan/chitin deacetylase (PgdA/CDA1 family)
MITMHHHIEYKKDHNQSWFHYQSANSFSAQMKMLHSHYSKNGVLDFQVTLDDGLKSQLATLEVLEEYGIKASFYYNTATLNGEFVANVHLLHILLKLLSFEQKEQLLVNLMKCTLSKKPRPDAEYIYRKQGDYSIDQELKFLVNYQGLSLEGDRLLKDTLSKMHSIEEINRQIYMNYNDLLEVMALGHRVLPHGHTHKILGTMTKSELRVEFKEMVDIHTKHFQTDVNELCVPFGSKYSWSSECETVAAEFGLTKIILVDPVKNILLCSSNLLEYISRTDCCLLDNYEYVYNENR